MLSLQNGISNEQSIPLEKKAKSYENDHTF
jgi:hypothetical protein